MNTIIVRVEKVTIDTLNNRFIVILKDDHAHRWMPIVVGPSEAQAIALQLERVTPPRPLSHDLMKSLLDAMEVHVGKVVITELKDNTYLALVTINKDGFQVDIDARPSDAIALALRTNSPIMISEEVMSKAGVEEKIEIIDSTDTRQKPATHEQNELTMLNSDLQRAIKDERFEDAARIRDQINELNKKSEGHHN